MIAHWFIHNVHFDAEDTELQAEVFEQVGTVHACRIARHPDGRSRGFAFVSIDTFGPEPEAVRQKLDGIEFQGRLLGVIVQTNADRTRRTRAA